MGSKHSSKVDASGGLDLNASAASPVDGLTISGDPHPETLEVPSEAPAANIDETAKINSWSVTIEGNPEGEAFVEPEAVDVVGGTKPMDEARPLSEEKQGIGDATVATVGDDGVVFHECPNLLEAMVEEANFWMNANGVETVQIESVSKVQSLKTEEELPMRRDSHNGPNQSEVIVENSSLGMNPIHVNGGEGAQIGSIPKAQSLNPEDEFPMQQDDDVVSIANLDDKAQAIENEPSRKKTSETGPQFFSMEEEATFSVSNMVWGKVKSHPWWPGEIFDPSDASEMAMKHQKEGKLLIAYFGDKTFAWNDESQLKPFYSNFSLMEKQSKLDAFADAVDDALAEVSRRVELGMRCSCFFDEDYNFTKQQTVENAGIREGTCFSAVDSSKVLNGFEPKKLLEYIEALALLPFGGNDRLELVIVKAQLKALYLSKGHPQLPVFIDDDCFVENHPEASPSMSKNSSEAVDQLTSIPSDLNFGNGKARGRPRSTTKHNYISKDGRKSNGGGTGSRGKGASRSSGKKHKIIDSDMPDVEEGKKYKLETLGEVESSSIPKSNGETKRVAKNNRRRGVGDGLIDALEVYSSPSEMLSDLYLAATDPMEAYDSLPMIITFFTDFRASSPSSTSMDTEYIVTRGSRRKSIPMETSSSDSLQDSYSSDVSFGKSLAEGLASSGRKRKGKSKSLARKKKAKLANQGPSVSIPLDTARPEMFSSKQESTEEKPTLNSGEKTTVEYNGEYTPTALILSFTESNALPTESDLVNIFNRYGPLLEAETEISKKTNRVKVVFKKRADAETAYSSAGKYSIFGPALVSYRLRYLPSAPKASSDAKQDVNDDSQIEGSNNPVEDVVVLSDDTEMRGCGD